MGRDGADLGGRRLHGGGGDQTATRDPRLEPQYDPHAAGAAGRERCARVRGRRARYIYRAKVSRRQCVRQKSRSFLEKAFGGDVAALLVHFVDEASLEKHEIEQLLQMLEQKKKPKEKRR